MTRIFNALTFALLFISTASFADETPPQPNRLNPQPGQWSSMVAILDNLNNHYLLKTTVNDDPETCAAQLHAVSSKIKEANGRVWTNPQKTALNYEKATGTDVSVKVLEIRCVLEPFNGELVQKY